MGVSPRFLLSLDCHTKQAGDECHLFHYISPFHAAHLPFPHHVHRFVYLPLLEQR